MCAIQYLDMHKYTVLLKRFFQDCRMLVEQAETRFSFGGCIFVYTWPAPALPRARRYARARRHLHANLILANDPLILRRGESNILASQVSNMSMHPVRIGTYQAPYRHFGII